MHIFVTGATGFIGSHFVLHAMTENHTVTILRRLSPTRPTIAWPYQPRYINSELLSLDPSQLQGVDGIAHFAATGVSPRIATWSNLEDTNIRGTLHMCNVAKEIGARITISGTYAEYGLSGNHYSLIPPWAPLEPTFPYAASKAAASILATSFARSEGIELAYLRIFNAFGVGQFQGNLWPSLMAAAQEGKDFPMTPGEQIRDFIDVSDAANWFLKSLTTASIDCKHPLVANIGSGHPQSICSFCKLWWSEWGATGKLLIGALPYRKGEVMRFVPEVDYSLFYS
jgi:UDP-glucose 4-epimerase